MNKIMLESPSQNTLGAYLAIAFCDGAVLDIASGPTACTALDTIHDMYPEIEIDEAAIEAALSEMQMETLA